jgi:alpha-L-fucosidase 2
VAYPLLKGSAEFLLDYMTVDPKSNYLVTGPSISPENSFSYNGQHLNASMMPTCDRVLAMEIFTDCRRAAEILQVDADFRDSLSAAIAQLPPLRLSANGGSREWFEDYEEGNPNHRHTTHLLALYPFAQITLDQTPKLAKGAEQTIHNRLTAPGWEDVEWSRANMICFYARLKRAEEAYRSVTMLENSFVRENLLSMSPAGIAGAPYDIFCLDGNTAGAAGIGEMLVQSHEDYVEFLPCLPAQWGEGSYQGLCVRGGGEVAATWSNGTLTKASLKALVDQTFRIKLPANAQRYRIAVNGKKITPDAETVSVSLKKGEVATFIRQ